MAASKVNVVSRHAPRKVVFREKDTGIACLRLLGTVVAASGTTLVEQPISSGVLPTYLDGADWKLQHLTNGSASSSLINATVPGDILTDLQRAGRIPDPYWNTSWREPSFIAAWNTGSWRYSKRFTSPATLQPDQHVLLCFDGVLMGATFELNGVPLTTTINPLLGNVTGATDQFLRYVFPIGRLLRPGGASSNILSATFGVAENDRPGTSNGRFTFSTGIDWAPKMLTSDRQGRPTFGFGLWKSIYLLPLPHGLALTHMVPLTFYAGGHPTSRLPDTNHAGFVVNITLDLYSIAEVRAAHVTAVGSWEGAAPVSRTVALKAGNNAIQLSIPATQTKEVRLWHPNGHGDQPLYNISATVSVAATPRAGIVSASRRIGFRHTALVTINDTNTTELAAAATMQSTGDFTMMFRVNGAAVYARGGSMIPMDLLNGRLSAEAHRRLVQSAAEGVPSLAKDTYAVSL
jgi:beta-mannosidase